jgi:hypothetical protein
VLNGSWTLGGNSLPLRNNGDVASPLTLAGKITGTAAGTILLSTNVAGAIIKFSNAGNTYTGATTVTGAGATGAGSASVRFELGATNAIATTASLILAGGTLDPQGFNQNMSNSTLQVLTNTGNTSAIDFSAGNAEIDFKDSHGVSWTGTTLNLVGWVQDQTLLRFGTSASGLTSAQLADIEFNGDATSKGKAFLTSAGYLLPEPTTCALLLLGAPVLAGRRRKAR